MTVFDLNECSLLLNVMLHA